MYYKKPISTKPPLGEYTKAPGLCAAMEIQLTLAKRGWINGVPAKCP